MKTKEEVIKEAWGKHWGTLTERGKEQALEDSGYCNKNYVHSDLDCEIEVHSFPDMDFIRPKSLAGIENNNGWKSVYGDMPPENSGLYFVYGGKDVDIARMSILQFRTLNSNEVYSEVTHYQPIVKPLNPIY